MYDFKLICSNERCFFEATVNIYPTAFIVSGVRPRILDGKVAAMQSVTPSSLGPFSSFCGKSLDSLGIHHRARKKQIVISFQNNYRAEPRCRRSSKKTFKSYGIN
uniref:(northern house mosquito) hypothetical protein n=1 Tax=Culex pipiens TaxID=7175 RepID=A0A8D8CC95_CULPI